MKCLKEERINVFEFFGVIIVNDFDIYDVDKVFWYIKCIMDERFWDILFFLLKREMEFLLVYENRKES